MSDVSTPMSDVLPLTPDTFSETHMTYVLLSGLSGSPPFFGGGKGGGASSTADFREIIRSYPFPGGREIGPKSVRLTENPGELTGLSQGRTGTDRQGKTDRERQTGRDRQGLTERD